jgi:hypothetical protein
MAHRVLLSCYCNRCSVSGAGDAKPNSLRHSGWDSCRSRVWGRGLRLQQLECPSTPPARGHMQLHGSTCRLFAPLGPLGSLGSLGSLCGVLLADLAAESRAPCSTLSRSHGRAHINGCRHVDHVDLQPESGPQLRRARPNGGAKCRSGVPLQGCPLTRPCIKFRLRLRQEWTCAIPRAYAPSTMVPIHVTYNSTWPRSTGPGQPRAHGSAQTVAATAASGFSASGAELELVSRVGREPECSGLGFHTAEASGCWLRVHPS